MKSTYRFFVEGIDLSQRDLVIQDASLLHQMIKVLRLRPNDEVVLLDNSGFEYAVRILEVSPKELKGYLLAKKECATEPRVQIHLYQSLPKQKEKFELVLQKGTEVGITRFIPTRTERSEFKGKINIERSYNILKEAAEQSGRGKIPELFGERTFSDALCEAEGMKLFFDPLGASLKSYPLNASRLSLFIGPEGGFSPAEIKLAEQHDAKIVSLGKRLLRTETAPVVAASLVLFLAGEL